MPAWSGIRRALQPPRGPRPCGVGCPLNCREGATRLSVSVWTGRTEQSICVAGAFLSGAACCAYRRVCFRAGGGPQFPTRGWRAQYGDRQGRAMSARAPTSSGRPSAIGTAGGRQETTGSSRIECAACRAKSARHGEGRVGEGHLVRSIVSSNKSTSHRPMRRTVPPTSTWLIMCAGTTATKSAIIRFPFDGSTCCEYTESPVGPVPGLAVPARWTTESTVPSEPFEGEAS